MSQEIPTDYLDLLTEKLSIAHFATINPDGTPQITPVWVDYVDGHILINGASGRIKDRNVRENPAVALSITDPDNPFRYLAIQGRVVAIIDDVTREHADKLVRKYTDEPGYSGSDDPRHMRRIYKIAPQRVFATDAPNRHKR